METPGSLLTAWKRGDEETWGVRCAIHHRVSEKYSPPVTPRGTVASCKGSVLNLPIAAQAAPGNGRPSEGGWLWLRRGGQRQAVLLLQEPLGCRPPPRQAPFRNPGLPSRGSVLGPLAARGHLGQLLSPFKSQSLHTQEGRRRLPCSRLPDL